MLFSLCVEIHTDNGTLALNLSVKILRESFVHCLYANALIPDQCFCRFKVSLIECACFGYLVKSVILVWSCCACDVL